MEAKNDSDLLGEYARDKSQDAFTALVQRHLNLVYCAGLRQVRSPQLAEEVAQSVFTDLARNASRLRPGTILTAWLYEVTRRTAINVVRGEARRQLREQVALEMNAMNATANDWTQIEPLLDEAMSALREEDRSALLLRYFENKSLREVGQSLGTTDDTARKRVNRAIESLRKFLARRGVSVGASSLVLVISANAVQAAPLGLVLTISTAATIGGATLAAISTATASKAIAMTITQKALLTTVLAAAVATGVHQAHEASVLRKQVSALHEQQTTVGAQLRQVTDERDAAVRRLTAGGADEERTQRAAAELLKLRGEVATLRAQAAEAARSRAELAAANQKLARVQSEAGAGANLSPEEIQAQKAEALAVRCVSNLKQIGLAARMWANDHGDVFPQDLVSMKNELVTPKVLFCPADPAAVIVGDWAQLNPSSISYRFLNPGGNERDPQKLLTTCPIHGHVGLSDGSVQRKP